MRKQDALLCFMVKFMYRFIVCISAIFSICLSIWLSLFGLFEGIRSVGIVAPFSFLIAGIRVIVLELSEGDFSPLVILAWVLFAAFTTQQFISLVKPAYSCKRIFYWCLLYYFMVALIFIYGWVINGL